MKKINIISNNLNYFPSSMKTYLRLIPFLFFLSLNNYNLNAQEKYIVNDEGLNGVYSGVVKINRGSKLTNIYLYEYFSNKNTKYLMCKIEQFESKRDKGDPTVSLFTCTAFKTNNGAYSVRLIGSLKKAKNNLGFSGITVKPDESLTFAGRSVASDYSKSSTNSAEYQNFLDEFYSALLFNKNGNSNKKVIIGSLDSKDGKQYGQKPQSGIVLETEFSSFQALHNSENIEATYSYDDMTPGVSKIETMAKLIQHLMSYRFRAPVDPFISHFPKLKTIRFRDPETNVITHEVKVEKGRGIIYRAHKTELGNQGIANHKEQLEVDAAINTAKESWKRNEKLFTQRGITRDYIKNNVGLHQSYKLIYFDDTANYFLMGNNDDQQKRVYISVIHDIGLNDDYMKLDDDLGLAYKVTDEYINNLENTVLPLVASAFPIVNEVYMSHSTQDMKLKSYEQITNHTSTILYSTPLTIILQRVYKKNIINYYTKGNGFWKHNAYGGCLIEYNSKNFAEANAKYDKAVKANLKPNWGALQNKYQAAKSKNKIDQKEIDNNQIEIFFKKNNYTYLEKSFWNNLDGDNQEIIKNFYEGNFKELSISGSRQEEFLYRYFVNYTSQSCKSLLPLKTVNFSETIESGGKTYSHTLYNGGMSFTNVYDNSEKTIINISIDMDPKFEKKYLEINEVFSTLKLSVETAKAYYDFFTQIKCDPKVFNLLGENLFRFFNNQPSIQIEAGVFKN